MRRCPECGSSKVEETTKGAFLPKCGLDVVNRGKCHDCGFVAQVAVFQLAALIELRGDGLARELREWTEAHGR
jgi:hypothetical protein